MMPPIPLSSVNPSPRFLQISQLTISCGKPARGWVYSGRGRAADAVQLDGIPGPTFRILCKGKLLETMDQGQAFREAHKGAIMLHQGITYIVNEMDLETHTVRVSETDVDYYTQPLKEVSLSVH